MLRFAQTELKKTSRQICCCNFLTHPWATEAHEQAIELAPATEPEEPLAPQPPNYPPPQALLNEAWQPGVDSEVAMPSTLINILPRKLLSFIRVREPSKEPLRERHR